MLPTLTMSFVAGLLLGSQILYFPLSTSFPLLLSALGAFALERRNLVSIRQATCLYGALLAGVAYWSVVANLSSHGSMVGYSSDALTEVTGRIVAPVQQAPDRLVMIIRSDSHIDASGRSGEFA